ncbi:hypothetical protein D3C72_1525580 [compost metagenome]
MHSREANTSGKFVFLRYILRFLRTHTSSLLCRDRTYVELSTTALFLGGGQDRQHRARLRTTEPHAANHQRADFIAGTDLWHRVVSARRTATRIDRGRSPGTALRRTNVSAGRRTGTDAAGTTQRAADSVSCRGGRRGAQVHRLSPDRPDHGAERTAAHHLPRRQA